MNCERCGVDAATQKKNEFSLHDYCNICSRNLCDECMAKGTCRESPTRKHQPAKQ